jgi:hypothetical protein
MRCLDARETVSRSTPKVSTSRERFRACSGGEQQRELSQEIKKTQIGAWRSLVAHWHGGPGVSSSNLLAPTNV